MNTKIITMYLPQFHCIPENDEFWGKGFTDWVTVKNASPLFEGHQQPRIPLNNNYYDLSVKETVVWQSKLAKEFGIYGFGVYHYWFNNEKNLLTKPVELIRDNPEIDINYCFVWDNNNWKRSWSNVEGNSWAPVNENPNQKTTGPKILIPYVLGEKSDWKKHFDYINTFFKDKRYIRKDNRPVFCIFNYSPSLDAMVEYWNKLAKESGFDGIFIIYKYLDKFSFGKKKDVMPGLVKYNYEPIYHGWYKKNFWLRVKNRFLKEINYQEKGIHVYEYDDIWKKILKDAENVFKDESFFHGGFVDYDDTPRRGRNGKVVKGSTPEKFKKYLRRLIEISERQGKEYLFLTAWNEWGEGAYLEPDTNNGLKYLEVIKEIMKQ